MSNAQLGWINYFVNGTVSGGGLPPTGFAASNLAGPVAYPPWRSANGQLTAVAIDIDAGSAVSWGAVALFRTNFTTGAQIRVKLGTTQGDNSVYDSGSMVSAGIVAGYGQFIFLIPAATGTARWMRLLITDAANPDNYLLGGLGFAGPLATPSRNFSYGQSHTWQDDSKMNVTKGGQKYAVQSPQYRKQAFTLANLTETDAWTIAAELARYCGIQKNVLFVPDPGGSHMMQQSVFGSLAQTGPQTRTAHGRYSIDYEIDERL